MSQILVLVDHVEGSVRKTTFELLTIARRLGEPAAVFVGRGWDAAAPSLAEYGAARAYVVAAEDADDYLVVPKVEALQAAIAAAGDVGAVLVPSSSEGKEVAGRLAVRLDSGIITDAVDVQPGDAGVETTQAAFAGGYSVKAHVSKGVPVVTVKPNSAAPEASPAQTQVADARRQLQRRREGSPDRRAQGEGQERAPGPLRGGDRRLRRPRHNGDFGPVEALRRRARCRRRRVPGGRRRRLVPAQQPGRPDRQAGLAAAVRRGGHLRRHPAPSRHADEQDHRRGEQGPGGADLRARRLRRRRRPVHRAARRPRRPSRSARADPSSGSGALGRVGRGVDA